jgi:2-polyprenyl-6-methoxyphenol hydroxylase-like FAD-dependent oxidoreductase
VQTLPTVEVRYNKSLESFRQNGQDVIADVVDSQSGQHSVIEANYLVVATEKAWFGGS